MNWSGVRVAIAQMVATVDAAAEGQRWIRQSSARFDGPLALGVLHLTQPRAAEQLVLDAPAHWHRERIGALLPNTGPGRVTDLSDAALKAMCDRNGWLLGTSDERTMREVVERQIRRAASRPEGRAALASGDLAGFGDAVAHVTPSLEDLERHVWRYDPASLTVRQGRHCFMWRALPRWNSSPATASNRVPSDRRRSLVDSPRGSRESRCEPAPSNSIPTRCGHQSRESCPSTNRAGVSYPSSATRDETTCSSRPAPPTSLPESCCASTASASHR